MLEGFKDDEPTCGQLKDDERARARAEMRGKLTHLGHMRKKALRGHLEAKCILPRILRHDLHLGDSLRYLRAILGPSWGHLRPRDAS